MDDIHTISTNKKRFLDLLLIGDEDEAMIDRYLDRCELLVLMEEGRAAAVCAVTREGSGIVEIKNLATRPESRRRGYACALINRVERQFACEADTLRLGTGEVPGILQFYARRGFVFSHRLPHFFRDHYARPIIDEGVLLDDMIVLQKPLSRQNEKSLHQSKQGERLAPSGLSAFPSERGEGRGR